MSNRLDTGYYSPIYIKLEQRLARLSVNSLQKISIRIKKGIFYILASEYVDSGVPFVRISNLKEGTIISNNLTFITTEKNLEHSQTEFHPNDILMSKTGNIAVSVIPEKYPRCNISQDVIGVELKPQYNPKFVSIFLNSNLGFAQLTRMMQGQVQPHLTLGGVQQVKIPILSLALQEEIVEVIEDSYTKKKQNEQEAERLLESIDSVVLEALGINLPTDEKGGLERRIFQTNFRVLTGSRYDPIFHKSGLYAALDDYEHDIKTIGEVSRYLRTGFAAGKSDQELSGNGIIQIRPTNMLKTGELNFDKCVYISRDELEARQGELLSRKDVLFNNTNSQVLVGKTSFFDLEGDYLSSNHVTRIGVNEEVIQPEYLTHLLNVYQKRRIFYRMCTNWNNQSGINAELLATVKIPVPPLELQAELVEKIRSIFSRARQLGGEAQAGLEKAKQEVERMILGDVA